ncbi:MAG TPA: 1-deoxy-D-xylulose-5-phosphate reductoisomerase [Haloplasmataceae bacterium]
MKNLILLGATGSIGTQTLEVLDHLLDEYQLVSIAFGKNLSCGIEIIKKYRVQYVSVADKDDCLRLKELFPYLQVGYGIEGLIQASTFDANNTYQTLVVSALVGSVGLIPTIEAIKKGYDIALANKETLVTAGNLVTSLVNKHKVKLLPIDSEHSALFQALNGEEKKTIKRLIITASGGAFRDKSRDELQNVSVNDALNHPNWQMGAKITIDSATMMNKGFEVIEAHHLFQVPYEKISTLLHKESIIHSLVEFIDTSIIAQLSNPDMKLPILYALTYPHRTHINSLKSIDLEDIASLHFAKMDFKRYPCLEYAYYAGKIGHSLPVVLNASNEAAVKLFLESKITFLDIERIIYNALEKHEVIKNPDLYTILYLDKEIKEQISSMKGV